MADAKPEGPTARVEKILKAMPDITYEQLGQLFPDIESNQIRKIRSKYIQKLKLAEFEKGNIKIQPVSELDPLAELKPLPTLPKGRPKKVPDCPDELPPPTGRHWKGEIWKIDQMGKLVWYRPAIIDTSYAHWYETFWLNEFNFFNPSPLGRCHKHWGSILDSGIKKPVFLCPRDHFKSSFITNGYMGENICEHRDGYRGILNIAWDKDLAMANMLSVVQNLQNNSLILDFYGYLIDEDRPCTALRKYFTFQPKGSRPGLTCAAFKTGAITGTHPHLVMLDDIQDEPLSDVMMGKFHRIVDNKLIPAAGLDGRIITTGTIKGYDAENDGYLWLKTKPTFEVFQFPAIINADIPPLSDCQWSFELKPLFEDGKPKFDYEGNQIQIKKFKITIKNREQYKTLYPERYSIEDLMEKYLELLDRGKSPDVFYSEYLLIPSNPKGNFFDKERIRPMVNMPLPRFHNVVSFMEFAMKYHVPIYLWIDPGGETGHGICMAVIAKYQGCYFILDLVVIRAGLPEAAKTLARLIEKWNIKIWGVEGNWQQKETYGRTLARELKNILQKENKMYLFSPPAIKSNTKDKIQRIRDGMTSMMGVAGMDYTFFVNENAQAYDRFVKESKEFSLNTAPGKKHEYDLLDAIVSAEIWLMGKSQVPTVASHK